MIQLIDILKRVPEIGYITSNVKLGKLPSSLSYVSEELKQHILHYIYTQCNRTIIYVSDSGLSSKRRYDAYPYQEAIWLPEPQIEYRSVEIKDYEIRHQRITALNRINSGSGVIFTSMNSLLYKMRKADKVFSQIFKIKVGTVIDPKDLIQKFTAIGYEFSNIIEAPGEISGRGEIVEIFIPGSENPYRITFFDDEVETIKEFSADTQRSKDISVNEITVTPSHEYIFDDREKEELITYIRSAKAERLDSTKEMYINDLEDSHSFSGAESFADVLSDKDSILSYCSDPLIVFDDLYQLNNELDRRIDNIDKLVSDLLTEGNAFGCERSVLYTLSEFLERNEQRVINLERLEAFKFKTTANEVNCHSKTSVGFMGNIPFFCDSIRTRVENGFSIYLCVGGKLNVVKQMLTDNGFYPAVGEILSDKGISVLPLNISEGFELESEKLLVLSEKDIFGKQKTIGRKKSSKKKEIVLIADLNIGDIVVHEVHGKGKYLGLKTMEVSGVSSDYMEIEYRDGDKLYIPTAQIGRLDKYIGSDDEIVALSKLGGKDWESAKSKARTSVKKIAEDLVSIYRERSIQKGYQFSPDTVWQNQFEDNFEYTETPGQLESIEEIKRDMESPKIMDRLLLGDVGYGKTEVAMRAAFKAVMDSKQVVVLVPTTILVRQHYKNFVERFSGFPITIEYLSRYTKKPKQVLSDLETGKADIVIGTHKLLSKTIKYKNLGLLIIDEEHRFGVSHKERIKDIKRTVDVLTMTATPIPRTLEMALTGIRDISTIDTPPDIRKEVFSYVVQFDWDMIKDVILKEMGRGGQVFFVCRRISEMPEILSNIKRLIPYARVATAHGQMSSDESEKIIEEFIDFQYDVLLCTTIIESGVDIPNVNTIVIYEADKFGLAQLYQLKGRVGRSSQSGYAYFTHKAGDNLKDLALKRLEAIKEFTQLGSGMHIAMRDLQIRGAGNLLGAEQSGHLFNVGYNLYIKMVKEAISENLGEEIPEVIDTVVELGEDAYIPTGYIAEENLRLDMYKKISYVADLKEAKELQQEFIDRFGSLPKQVENLIVASICRQFAQKAGIQNVIRMKDTIQLRFAPTVSPDLDKLIKLINRYKGRVELRRADTAYLVYGHKKGKSYKDFFEFLTLLKHCISFVK